MNPEILNLHIKVLSYESNSVIPTIFLIRNKIKWSYKYPLSFESFLITFKRLTESQNEPDQFFQITYGVTGL